MDARTANQREPALLEEIANAATHGVGAALSLAGLVALLLAALRTGETLAVVAAAIYGGSLTLLYLASTLYHSLPWRRIKRWFQLADHCAIFLLIAGTYTPFALLLLPREVGLPLLAAIWACAIAGIGFKVFSHCRAAADHYDRLSVLLYLAMGWLGLFWAGKAMMGELSPEGVAWLIAGGLAYTGGIAFYLAKRLPFAHAVWHLFVLGASGCHFWSVLAYVVPAA